MKSRVDSIPCEINIGNPCAGGIFVNVKGLEKVDQVSFGGGGFG